MKTGRRFVSSSVLAGVLVLPLSLTTVLLSEEHAGSPAPISHLGDLLNRNLDAALEGQLAQARLAASAWQADARLHEVHLRLGRAGEIGWEFLFLSDDSGLYLKLLSRGKDRRADAGEDSEAADKPTLDLAPLVGFNRAVKVLADEGVDLAGIAPSEVNQFELSHHSWRNPAGYYYNLFLSSRAPFWIVAETGELQE